MSQNGHSSMHSRGPGAGGTTLSQCVINPPGSSMNLSSSPSVSWSHVNNGTSASAASGNQSVSVVTAQQQDAKAASSPENSNQSGATLKEHDLLGLSEVSSSSSRESPSQEGVQDEGNEFEELNLQMQLGPPAARKKADTGFSLPRTPAAGEQQQQPLAAPENGNSHGGSEASQVAEQGTVMVDKNSSVSEQNGSAAEQADRGLCYVAPSQGGRVDACAGHTGCRPDSETMLKWHPEQAGDRKSSSEGLRLGMSLSSQRGGTQEGLNEKKTFLSSMERNREAPQELKQQEDPSWQQERIFQEDVSNMEKTQERPTVGQEHQVTKQQQQQQQQLERLKQYEVYQMTEKRPGIERKCLPALQQPGAEQRFQNVPERSPRLSESQSRLWQSQMKFRPECMVTSSTQFQQHSAQQDIEGSRAGYSVCAGNFAVNRNMYAAQKLGVTGAKRNFDAITGCDARNVNEARNGLSGPSTVAGGSVSTGSGSSAEAEVKALSQQQMKVQPPMQMYPWGQKTPLATSTWHIGLEQSGGSFGPFPSAQRPTSGVSVSKTASEIGVGVVGDAKTWDGQSKVHQDIVSTSSRKMPAPADVKPASTEATTVLAETSAASAQRTAAPAPTAVGWPPLRSFRKNLAVTPRPIPSETPAPRQPSTPTPPPVSTPSIAGQSNSWFVKVNMDGYPVGRKVDLRINNSYDKLSQALDDMFRSQFETFLNGQNGQNRIPLPSDLKRNFLQGPDFVLTYEDQDGDLMLVGDVPWTMFIDTVKRLRIMKGSEAIGLGNRAAEKSIKTAQPNV